MREIYAAELIGGVSGDNAKAWELVRGWVEPRLHPGEGHPVPASIVAEETAASGARYLAMEQADTQDETLIWRSEVAVGPPDGPLHATARIRLGAAAGAPLAPLRYDFRAPVIVRTLLKEFAVLDGPERCLPSGVELGASDVPALVDFLTSAERRLPVVVVSSDGTSARLETALLSQQLAGIAHVRSLASNHAAWTLTETVGPSLSVYRGAVRIYFPGFAPGDEPRRHRLYLGERVSDELIGYILASLSALASSRTPSHPVFADLREDRRQRVAALVENAESAELFRQYTEALEADLSGQRSEIAELRRQNDAFLEERDDLENELQSVRNSFAEYSRYLGQTRPQSSIDDPTHEPANVAEAMDAVIELAATTWYSQRVEVTGAAFSSGREFNEYHRPGQLLRAVQAVMEAGALYHDDKLGEPPADFFSRRGFGFGALPQPHLKVDESTSPDQCLRIYWQVNSARRMWMITHIGRHQ